jgi:hypothetical protein
MPTSSTEHSPLRQSHGLENLCPLLVGREDVASSGGKRQRSKGCGIKNKMLSISIINQTQINLKAEDD